MQYPPYSSFNVTPFQTFQHPATHHPFEVAFREEIKLFGEHGHRLAIGTAGRQP